MIRPLIALSLLLGACQTTREQPSFPLIDQAAGYAAGYRDCLVGQAVAYGQQVKSARELEYVIAAECRSLAGLAVDTLADEPWLDAADKRQFAQALDGMAQTVAVRAFY